jgi:hypothetical protein
LGQQRTASTAVAPGGPAERHLLPSPSSFLFMGASPQTPGLAALEYNSRDVLIVLKGLMGVLVRWPISRGIKLCWRLRITLDGS